MLHLALDGITSLSVKPISLIAEAGIVVSMAGFIGIQLLSLGVIGEYIGKIYLETKRRPRYIISDRTWRPYVRHYKEEGSLVQISTEEGAKYEG